MWVGENSTAVCGFGCKKNPSVGSLRKCHTKTTLHLFSWKTVIHLTGSPSVFKCDLLARAG